MPRYKPGRLHRKLSPNGTPLFEIVTSGRTFNDLDINSFTIRRGNADASPEISPSSLTFKTPGANSIPAGTSVKVRLTTYASILFAGAYVSRFSILERFNGRRAACSVEDIAWKAGRSSKFYTDVSATSWTSLLRNTSRRVSATAGQNVGSELAYAMNHPGLVGKQETTVDHLASFDTVYETENGLTMEEITSKYGTELQTLFQHRRSGSVSLLTQNRRNYLLDYPGTLQDPILRSQTLSPAEWDTDIETESTQFIVNRRLANGTPYSQVWPLPTDVTAVTLKDQEINMLHVLPTGNWVTYSRLANSLNLKSNYSRMEIKSLRFDMIQLLSSSRETDRKCAAQLLFLEAGNAIYLSGDWPEGVRAPYFANEITETVTPDSWEIQLTVFHPRDVLGRLDSEIKPVPAKAWDSATYPWNDETRQWNQA